MTIYQVKKKCIALVTQCLKDLGNEFTDKLKSLKCIYLANFNENTLLPLDLLNVIKTLKLKNLFPNLTVTLRIFITIYATVAILERSFLVLKRVKTFLRATMCQDKVSSLGVLAVEQETGL